MSKTKSNSSTCGSAPPVNQEPAPLGTITILCSFTIFLKYQRYLANVLGKTTASGSNLSFVAS